jgi:hypothetical protein
MEYTHGVAHVKTAGTSYLEALRTIAQIDPWFLSELYEYARAHFETDKQSYVSSAQLSLAPQASPINNWLEMINQFDTREILHMTYGSVLTGIDITNGNFLFYDQLMRMLSDHRELYFHNLETHFNRHLVSFME